jgi:hypothetical protein
MQSDITAAGLFPFFFSKYSTDQSVTSYIEKTVQLVSTRAGWISFSDRMLPGPLDFVISCRATFA